MNIKSIRSCGFDKLYYGYKSAIDSGNNLAYGTKLFSFLKNCMISLDIFDLSTIEVFYLKSMCTNLIKLDKTYSNFIPKERTEEYNSAERLINLMDEIILDSDINTKNIDIDTILPIGCIRYHVIVEFTGPTILSIVGGLNIIDIFKDSNSNFLKSCPSDLEIENKLSEFFYKSFYLNMSEKMTEFDLVSEFTLDKTIYDYSDEKCTLAYINTPYGAIDFLGSNSDRLNYQLNRIQKSRDTSPYDMSNIIYASFILNTSFNVFFKLFTETNYVIDNKNLKIVSLNNKMIINPYINQKYNKRISELIRPIDNYRKLMSSSSIIDLNRFNYIINGDLIQYIIQIPISKMDNLKNIDEEFINLNKSINNILESLKVSLNL